MTNLPAKLHSELGASVASRWMACPGSVRMSRGMPNFETDHSRAGTAAHAVAELCLRKSVDPDVFEETTIEGVEVDANMVAAVRVYVDYCRTLMQEPGAQWWIEKQFSLASLNPPAPMFGTGDFPIYKPALREIEIVDYKNGSGVVVQVKGNKQTRYYALGTVLELGPGFDIETVKMTIVQPNAAHPDGVIRSETITYGELLEFAGELLEAARATLKPDAPLVPGNHCRFCPASAVCPAQREQAQVLAQVAFADMPLAVPPAPETMPPEVISDILTKLHVLEDWAASIRAHAQRELEAGKTVPGFKLVEGRKGNRQWGDESATAKWLEERGYGEDETHVRELKSPAQIEKLVGKKSLPNELTTRKDGRPVMAPTHDPRPVLTLHAGDAFVALPSGE